MRRVFLPAALLAAAPALAQAATLTGQWRYDFPASMFMGFDEAKSANCAAADPVINFADPKAVNVKTKDGWIAYAPTGRQDGAGPVTWKLWIVEPMQSKVAQMNAYTDVTAAFADPAAAAAKLRASTAQAEEVADEAVMHWASDRSRGVEVKWVYYRRCG